MMREFRNSSRTSSGRALVANRLRSLLGQGRTTDGGDDLLLRLAVSMRAHKRGGTLLVVPAESGKWRESILRPVHYLVEPPFRELADLLGGESEDRALALGRAVDEIAGLSGP